MNVAVFLISFFVLTFAAVSAAGYVFVLKPARVEEVEAPAPEHAVLKEPDLPIAQAAVLDMFRLIGEAMAWD